MAEINRIHPNEKMRQMSARQMVADLRANRAIGRIELVVLRVYPRRMVSTSRYTGPVAAACGMDESGLVGIVLWDEQVKNVQIGDIIRIESGWCREREGELVVSSGKNGRLTVIDR